jgi:hypothetical protein
MPGVSRATCNSVGKYSANYIGEDLSAGHQLTMKCPTMALIYRADATDVLPARFKKPACATFDGITQTMLTLSNGHVHST